MKLLAVGILAFNTGCALATYGALAAGQQASQSDAQQREDARAKMRAGGVTEQQCADLNAKLKAADATGSPDYMEAYSDSQACQLGLSRAKAVEAQRQRDAELAAFAAEQLKKNLTGPCSAEVKMLDQAIVAGQRADAARFRAEQCVQVDVSKPSLETLQAIPERGRNWVISQEIQRRLQAEEEQNRADEAGRRAAAQRTDPGTWGKAAWMKFQWGMGKGDVIQKLSEHDPEGMSCAGDQFSDRGEEFSCRGANPVLDRAVDITFKLAQGRLVAIDMETVPLQQDINDPATRSAELGWFKHVRDVLVRKYGSPSERKDSDATLGGVFSGVAVPTIVWKKRDLRLDLKLGAEEWEEGRALRASIRYSDPRVVVSDEAKAQRQL
jgi:hypothetical protein